MGNLIVRWVVATVAVIASAAILPGVEVRGILPAFLTALILAISNAVLKPILVLLTFPITFITLGLFVFVINAALVMLTAVVVPGFEIVSFWWALLFSVVLSLVHWALYALDRTR